MAIEFYEHFERGDNLQAISFTGSSLTSSPLSGNRSWTVLTGGMTYGLPATATKVFHFLWRSVAFDAVDDFFRWQFDATTLGKLRLNDSTFKVDAYVGTSLVGSSTSTYALNSTNHFQTKVTISDASGLLEVKINGVTEISFSGDTKPGADTTINRFGFFAPTGANPGHAVDDIVVDNADYLGDVRIKYFFPTANGTHTAWTGTYADVDEVPNDGDTTKITSTVDGEKESFTFAAHGLEATSEVLAVCPEAVAKGTSSSISLGFRIGGTDYMQTAQPVSGTYDIFNNIVEVDPSDTNSWVLADLVPEVVLESEI